MEINFVRVVGDRFEPDQFADKGAPNKTLTASPFDVATVAYAPGVPRARIARFYQLFGHRSIARPINLPRDPLAQSFMRTLMIVTTDPSSNASLLRRYAGCGRSGHIGSQYPMHLFVRAVVLRVSWPDKLHRDPQAQPPHALRFLRFCGQGFSEIERKQPYAIQQQQVRASV